MQYLVKHPLSHDGKSYAPGSLVELGDEAAEPLLAVKTIALQGKVTESDSTEQPAKASAAAPPPTNEGPQAPSEVEKSKSGQK
jgi:hypothetical protein